jgi:filamentous hemagglutinin family protein
MGSATGYKARRKTTRANRSIAGVLSVALVVSATVTPAYAQLPVPCGGGNCGGKNWVGSGSATSSINGKTLNIRQHTDKATLNWAGYNIGRDNTVKYIQPDATSVALNRIFQGSASQILGNITANGQVYLINPNGFLFGKDSAVNVNTLIASTLDITDEVFQNGLPSALRDNNAPAFIGNLLLDEEGNPLDVKVEIEKGALLKSAESGRVMVFAPSIENRGRIETPQGQTVLAAGQQVWLQPEGRNFLVEVDTGGDVTNLGSIVAKRGNISLVGMAVNQEGRLTATTTESLNGSVRLVAQDTVKSQTIGNKPVISAQQTGEASSVTFGEDSLTQVIADFESSIDAVDDQEQELSRIDVTAQTIHLEENSIIKVPAGVVNLVATASPASQLKADRGRNNSRIQMDAGSKVDVSGMTTAVRSASDNIVEVELRGNELKDSPVQRNGVLRGKKVKVDIRKGTPIGDISGALNNIKRPIDERLAVGGAIGLLSEGDVVINKGAILDFSGGQVAYEAGFIDTTKVISEGRIYDISDADPLRRYSGIVGEVERKVAKWGQDITYVVPGATSTLSYQESYVEGKDAGRLNIIGREIILDGTLKGEAQNGQYQRLPTASLPRNSGGVLIPWGRSYYQAPAGGILFIGDLENRVGSSFDRTPQVFFQSGVDVTPVEIGTDLTLLNPDLDVKLKQRIGKVLLPEDIFLKSGVTTAVVTSNSSITVDKGVSLKMLPGSELVLSSGASNLASTNDSTSAGNVLQTAKPDAENQDENLLPSLIIKGNISVPGGVIGLETDVIDDGSFQVIGEAVAPPLVLANGANLDVSGRWVNDSEQFNSGVSDERLYIDGGQIDLRSRGDLVFENGSSVTANGGGHVTIDGQLLTGRGGDIGLHSEAVVPTRLQLDGSVTSFGIDAGGVFMLSAPTIEIDPHSNNTLTGKRFPATTPDGMTDADDDNEFITRLSPDLFASHGFSSYEFNSGFGGIEIKENTWIELIARNRLLDADFINRATDQNINSLGQIGVLPLEQRHPVNLQLKHFRAQEVPADEGVTIGKGAQVNSDPGAHVDIAADTFIRVEGAINTPGGSIRMEVHPPAEDDNEIGLVPHQGIWLGEEAILGARGAFVPRVNDMGLRVGDLYDAGTVSLTALRGFIATQAGSEIDVSGSAYTVDILNLAETDSLSSSTGANPETAGLYKPLRVATSAGYINLQASEGMMIEGKLFGRQADVEGARAGSLNISLDYTQSRSEGFNQDEVSQPGDRYRFPEGQRIIEIREQRGTLDFVPETGSSIFALEQLEALRPGDDGEKALSDIDARVTIAQQTIERGQFDILRLAIEPLRDGNNLPPSTKAKIQFSGDVVLTTRDQLILDAPMLTMALDSIPAQDESPGIEQDGGLLSNGGHSVNLASGYIAVGSTRVGQDDILGLNAPPGTATELVEMLGPETGASSLTVRAGLVDLIGTTTLQGFGYSDTPSGEIASAQYPVQLISDGDIRVRGLQDPRRGTAGELEGHFRSGTDLRLVSKQVYPTLLSDFAIQVQDAGVRVSIESNGSGARPYSGGGRITVEADEIHQAGNVRAPFGSVAFKAKNNLVLDAGSETSTSGRDLMIPYGQIELGDDWVYPISTSRKMVIDKTPAKSVTLDSPAVDLREGALIDLRGGGDLFAYEFIPGPGGSKDILLPENAGNAFAILPGYASQYGPYLPLENTGVYGVGETVYLDGVSVLPKGEYALLPPRFALLPGAFLVTPVPGTSDITRESPVRRIDGTPIVPGQMRVAGTDISDNRWSGYLLETSDQVHKRAEYEISYASDYLRNALDENGINGQFTVDAGDLVIDATLNSGAVGSDDTAPDAFISLRGRLDASGVGDGRGGQVDVLASRLAVVEERTTNIDRVEVLASDLTTLAPQSILLGGRRQTQAGGVAINVNSEMVSLESGILTIPEVVLVARDTISVKAEGGIHASGNAVPGRDSLLLNGDGALVRASTGAQVGVLRSRNGVPLAGTVNIEEGSQIFASGAIALDASLGADIGGTIATKKEGSLSFGSSRITIGDVADQETITGINLDSKFINNLDVSELVFSSDSSLDLFGDVSFQTNDLVVRASAISGSSPAQDSASGDSAAIVASTESGGQTVDIKVNGKLTLSANTGLVTGSDSSKSGSLRMAANELLITTAIESADSGEASMGALSIDGFDVVNIAAADQVVFENSVAVDTSNSLLLDSRRISGATGALMEITAGEQMILGNVMPGGFDTKPLDDLPPVNAVAARLDISGAIVNINTNIQLPAGEITIASANEQPVVLGNDAKIDLTGRIIDFPNAALAAPGGYLQILAEQGDIALAKGSEINVSGADRGGAAGGISLVAPNGVVQIKGRLTGGAVAGVRQADFYIDTKAFDASSDNDFSSINAVLDQGGTKGEKGFAGRRNFRIREGDIRLESIDEIVASEVVITADKGSVDIFGKINAAGESSGRIALHAAGDLTIHGSARLDASAYTEGQQGGEIFLATKTGTVDVRNGVELDVSGTKEITKTFLRGDDDGNVIPRTDPTGEVVGNGMGVVRLSTEETLTRDSGSIHIRAPQLADELAAESEEAGGLAYDSVAIRHLDGKFIGGDLTIEAYRSYDRTGAGASIDAADTLVADTNPLFADAQVFMQSSEAILERLGLRSRDELTEKRLLPRQVRILPGIDIIAQKDLTIKADWDFSPSHTQFDIGPFQAKTQVERHWRFGQDQVPGILTLRAADNLTVDGALDDGFHEVETVFEFFGEVFPLESFTQLNQDESWSFRLAAGADIESPDPLATRPNRGNLIVKRDGLIRTGTGDIDISSGGNVELQDNSAAIYTAGKSAGPGALDSLLQFDQLPWDYGHEGGSISIVAQGDIKAQPIDQIVTDWLPRIGGTDNAGSELPTAWAINPDGFRQNVGTLGGGDINIRTSGNLEEFSAVIATTGQQVGDHQYDGLGTVTRNELIQLGGGALDVEAKGDVLGGMFYVSKGSAEVRAGGSIKASDARSLAPVLALGDSEFDLFAKRELVLETALNPTVLAQTAPAGRTLPDNFFFSYADNTRLNMVSVAGNIELVNEIGTPSNRASLADLFPAYTGVLNRTLVVYPGKVELISLSGDIVTDNGFTLFPGQGSYLKMLAANNITTSGKVGVDIVMPDADHARIPVPERPFATLADASETMLTTFSRAARAREALQNASDSTALIIARDGDIAPGQGAQSLKFRFMLTQPADIVAGRDFKNIDLLIKHSTPNDVSLVKAGRNAIVEANRTDTGLIDETRTDSWRIAGPGRFEVQAGRDIDLGFGEGIVSLGNEAFTPFSEPGYFSLPDDGADIYVRAGIKDEPDLSGFVAAYFGAGSGDSDKLAEFLKTVDAPLSAPDGTELSDTERFTLLEPQQQVKFIGAYDVFFEKLRSSGKRASDSNDAIYFAEGFSAIDSLFPGFSNFLPQYLTDHPEIQVSGRQRNPLGTNSTGNVTMELFSSLPPEAQELVLGEFMRSNGDLSLLLSRIHTLDSADINLIVPGGRIKGGVASAAIETKPPSRSGVVAQKDGDINAFMFEDFLVNESRVFAVDGGNIMIWSSVGDIDAGRGAKTAIAVPPPILTQDEEGNPVVIFPPAISGSGIRGTVTTEGREAGDVDLFAPQGIINAGDAGIGSAGNLNVAAVEVIGSDNIEVAGVSTGTPTVSTSFTAGLGSINNVSSSVSKDAEDNLDRGMDKTAATSTTPLADQALSFLEVVVEGFGDEDL